MTKPLVAEFSDAESLIRAAARLRREGHQLLDAFTPFRLPELDGILPVKPPRVRLAMLLRRSRDGCVRLFSAMVQLGDRLPAEHRWATAQ